MILAVDVHYVGDKGFVAGVGFEDWTSSETLGEYLSLVEPVEAYVSGQFYKRELPCILHLIEEHELSPNIIVVDGFVFLDGVGKAGLGKYLFDALDGKVAVVGVAKNGFAGCEDGDGVLRGTSGKPLYVTAVGLDIDQARANITDMYGNYRTPAMLKLADRLCRDFAFGA